MSQDQWSIMFLGDEAYACAKSFERFQKSVQEFTGKKFVLPVHQGRGAERILAIILVQKGDYVLSNTFFDTTLENFRFQGGIPINLPSKDSLDLEKDIPFKGNVDVELLENTLKDLYKNNKRVALFTMTVTNNTGGGQPVSLENIEKTHQILKEYGIAFHIDACRVSENAYFIKKNEEKYKDWSILEIVRETLKYADIVTMSAKKDGLSNIGGFIATDNEKLYREMAEYLILWEGFITYGGLAGRDLEAIGVGLMESVNEEYLEYRVGQVEYLARRIRELDIPVVWPPGGHAVYIIAERFLSHIPKREFPAQSLVVSLYVEGGVRAVEVGSLMFSFKEGIPDLVRLAIPRRVYTESHLNYVAEVLKEIKSIRDKIGGLELIEKPEYLGHFLAKLRPVSGIYKT